MECHISYKSVQRILKAHPIPIQHRLPFLKFRDFKEPYQARVEVVKLYDKLLYETIARWGAPAAIVRDRGGAFISADYERACLRLDIGPVYSEPKQSWQNLIETHCAFQQRLSDFQFAQARSELDLQRKHIEFMDTYNTRMTDLGEPTLHPNRFALG